MATIYKPPTPMTPEMFERASVFLAGSIGMGKAENWQARVEADLASMDVSILNPRRDDFDVSAPQTFDNEYFSGQVNWEMDALDRCDVIAMYFDPNPELLAPVSMFELGLHMTSGKLVVCCPEGFARKGNVDIACERYGITVHDNVADFMEWIVLAVNFNIARKPIQRQHPRRWRP
jgi:hypothetical protein